MKINQNTSILFWLFKAKQSEDGKAPIYCRITIEGRRTEFSTGKKTDTCQWKPKPGEARGKSEEALTINRELNKIKAALQKICDQLEAIHPRITAEMVKNIFLGTGPQNKTIQEVFTEYNLILKERVQAKEPTLKLKTWQRFEITREKVTGFLKHKYASSHKLLRDLKNTFGEDFRHYLTTVEDIGLNTAMKYLKNTKQVLHYAVLQQYIGISPMAGFKCTYKNPKRERLTWQELIHLYETPMAIARLEEVKDVYVFSCFTGYAYMDVYKLTPENVLPWIDGSR
jgi:hypothetical protein